MPEQSVKGGLEQRDKVLRLIPKYIVRKMTHELQMKSSTRHNFGNTGVHESQVSILWNYGLWAHHGLKVGRALTSCMVMIARHVRG